MKSILLQHKEERDLLAAGNYIERSSPDARSSFLESSLIKIITGPRRCGKSVYAFLLLQNTNFAYANFDDDQLLRNFKEDTFIEAIHQIYGDFSHVFFDEIQNLPNWELLVNKLHRRKYNVVLTGSNARMLSRELATALTGRYISMELMPFSLTEMIDWRYTGEVPASESTPKQRGEILSFALNYLKNGGFPESAINPELRKPYLSTLFDSVIYKDIVKRFNVRNASQLNDLAVYLLCNYSSLYSYQSLSRELQFRSVESLRKYIHFLEETYLFFSVPRFSFKMKTQDNSARKVYVIDNGFIAARSFEFSPNYGRLLENLVAIELLRRTSDEVYKLFYYRTTNNLEVDFLIKENNKIKSLIQVAWDISSPKTLKREVQALIKASQELQVNNLIIITWDDEKVIMEGQFTISVIPFWKFALFT
ncbi:MAG: ATP-binding protein [Bacteroidetes bacterium]|nr:ATP-binding protein [Bacteroidota bacterium]MBU1719243.1 ATP-binding protein [Bacteroidota bacterium]